MKLADRGHLQRLSRAECLSLLSTVSVGRLGVSIQALPAILPVNFVLHDEKVVLRSVPGTKLDAATAQAVVAFEADEYGPNGEWGWSVLVQGVAQEITDPAELAEARSLGLAAWAFPSGEAYRYLRIDTNLISGRKFARSSSFRT